MNIVSSRSYIKNPPNHQGYQAIRLLLVLIWLGLMHYHFYFYYYYYYCYYYYYYYEHTFKYYQNHKNVIKCNGWLVWEMCSC